MSRPGPHRDEAPRAQRLIGQALRAQASGAATTRAGGGSATPTGERRQLSVTWYLMIALLVGVLVGVGLALLSVLAPGVLPAIG